MGKNNKGIYSLIIGCPVGADIEAPIGYSKIQIPSGKYLEFSVEKGRPDTVGEVWQKIRAIPDKEKQNWRFKCEFEHYKETGEISIFIGIN